jgi:hypothetical protein
MKLLNIQEYIAYQQESRSALWFEPSEGATEIEARLERQVAELELQRQWLMFFLFGARPQSDGQLKMLVV